MTRERKITKVHYCDRHRKSFLSESVQRRMETLCEGGWSHGGHCEGGRCRLWPGRDYFAAEYCGREMFLEWTWPQEIQTAKRESARKRANDLAYEEWRTAEVAS